MKMKGRERLTTDPELIFLRESITLNSRTKDDLRKAYNKIFDRLQEYEVEEENGVILRMPCAVGDEVFIDNRCILPIYINGNNRYSTCEVIAIVITRKQKLVKIAPIQAMYMNCRYHLRVPFSAFGKTVFKTEAEAEKALKDEKR